VAELILLVLLVMTLLGVRMLLTQFGVMTRLRLPGRITLPSLKTSFKRGSSRKRGRTAAYTWEGAAGNHAGALSPFVGGPDLLRAVTPLGYQDADEADELEEDYEDLPANQVDFFAEPLARTPSPAPTYAPAGEDPSGSAGDVVSVPEALLVPGIVSKPVIQADPDPNDIMSFFEKPPPSASLPDTLRESMQEVSAADLLEEARQIVALARRGQTPS
jgi:hypothetical protein